MAKFLEVSVVRGRFNEQVLKLRVDKVFVHGNTPSVSVIIHHTHVLPHTWLPWKIRVSSISQLLARSEN